MAQRFHFKLQVLLEVRQAEQDRRQRIVAERVQRVGGLQDEEHRLQGLAVEALRDAMASSVEQRLDVIRLARQRYWTAHLQRRVLACGLQIDQEQRALAAERAALVQAATACRVVEKLRDRLLAHCQTKLERVERREADEMALNQFRGPRAEFRAGAALLAVQRTRHQAPSASGRHA